MLFPIPTLAKMLQNLTVKGKAKPKSKCYHFFLIILYTPSIEVSYLSPNITLFLLSCYPLLLIASEAVNCLAKIAQWSNHLPEINKLLGVSLDMDMIESLRIYVENAVDSTVRKNARIVLKT